MKRLLFFFSFAAFLLSCNSDKEKTAATTSTTPTDSSASKVDFPYTATYTTNWSSDVSDADLKTVLMTYKDWEDANVSGLADAMGDSVEIDMTSGDHKKMPHADLMKMWTGYRDSLSSVKIKMDTWHKMYATDKKESYIVTWYDETDTYKTGKVDSASYHDINQVKDGKIVWYSSYKRPKK